MSRRLKWYRAAAIDRAAIDHLIDSFVKDEYVEGRKWGFSRILLHGQSIDGDYIERTESMTKVKDPFGTVLEFPSIRFDEFSFTVSTKFPNVEIIGVPRYLGNFFNQIAAYLSFTIALEPLKVDLLKWVAAIEAKVNSVIVSGALVVNLALSNSVQAKIAFSGTTEVRSLIKRLTGDYTYSFSKFQITGIHRSQQFKCELFADGRAAILVGIESEITKILRSSLREVAAI